MSFLRTLLQPRTLLLLFLGGGILGVVFVLLSASRPVDAPWREVPPVLLTGEVADFAPRDFPRPPPEVLVAGPGGEEVYLPDAVRAGRVTLVNLWASWCAPCLEELPSLAALAEATGAAVLPVAQERATPASDAAFARAGVADRLTTLRDPQLQLSRFYGGGRAQLPVTVIYDARGREVGQLAGAADWSSPEAVRLVEAVRDGTADF